MTPRPPIALALVLVAGAVGMSAAAAPGDRPARDGERVVPASKLRKAVAQREAWRAQARVLRVEVRDLRALTTLEPAANRELGRRLAAREKGWTGVQFAALDALWGKRESGWAIVWNRAGSGACHIPQSLPCSKIPGGINASPAVAIRWGMDYVEGRYGTPVEALAHSYTRGWY